LVPIFGPGFAGFGAEASISPTIHSASRGIVAKPASIAGPPPDYSTSRSTSRPEAASSVRIAARNWVLCIFTKAYEPSDSNVR